MEANNLKYQYYVRHKKALVTEIGSDPTKFSTKFFNELGKQGEEIINVSEHGEPSGINAANGQPIPYYVVTVLTKKAFPDDTVFEDDEDAEPAKDAA